jgi:hypothetical protein
MTRAAEARDDLRAEVEAARVKLAEAARAICAAFLFCGREPAAVTRGRLRSAQAELHRVDLALLEIGRVAE